jgi:broad specificity phosphatase PhoE
MTDTNYYKQLQKYNHKLQNSRKVMVHFIRHAQSTANKAAELDENEYSSEKWFDAELTPTGIEQAKKLQNIHIKPDLVYTSPFRRTFATLYYSLALINMNNIPVMVDNRLSEIKNGQPCNYNHYYDNVDYRPIETEQNLINRGDLWFHDMITYVKDKPHIKNVFVYTHGMFMYTFLNNSTLHLQHNCTDFPKNTQVCTVTINIDDRLMKRT